MSKPDDPYDPVDSILEGLWVFVFFVFLLQLFTVAIATAVLFSFSGSKATVEHIKVDK